MKYYTFENKQGEIIEQVIAENHDEAIEKAGEGVDYFTDFYSEDYE